MGYMRELLKKILLLIQTKKIAYLTTVFTGCFCLAYALRGDRELTIQWVSAFSVLTGFVTTGYLGGKWLMRGNPGDKQ